MGACLSTTRDVELSNVKIGGNATIAGTLVRAKQLVIAGNLFIHNVSAQDIPQEYLELVPNALGERAAADRRARFEAAAAEVRRGTALAPPAPPREEAWARDIAGESATACERAVAHDAFSNGDLVALDVMLRTLSEVLRTTVSSAVTESPENFCRPGRFAEQSAIRRRQFHWLGNRGVTAAYFLAHGGVAEMSRAIDSNDYATVAAMLIAFKITDDDWTPAASAATGRAAALTQEKLDIRAWPFLAIYRRRRTIDRACVIEILENAVQGKLALTRKLVEQLVHSQELKVTCDEVMYFTFRVTDIIGETPLCEQVHALLGEDFIPSLGPQH